MNKNGKDLGTEVRKRRGVKRHDFRRGSILASDSPLLLYPSTSGFKSVQTKNAHCRTPAVDERQEKTSPSSHERKVQRELEECSTNLREACPVESSFDAQLQAEIVISCSRLLQSPSARSCWLCYATHYMLVRRGGRRGPKTTGSRRRTRSKDWKQSQKTKIEKIGNRKVSELSLIF